MWRRAFPREKQHEAGRNHCKGSVCVRQLFNCKITEIDKIKSESHSSSPLRHAVLNSLCAFHVQQIVCVYMCV